MACTVDPVPCLQGSWTPIGFHGIHRTKQREDLKGLYRHIARPVQPCTFQRRMQQSSRDHPFSHADNKHSIIGLLFETPGMGRRKSKTPSSRGQKDLLKWMPLKDEMDNADPLASTYAMEFRGIPPDRCELRHQKYIPRLHLLYEDHPFETSFRVDIGQQSRHRRPGPTCKPLPRGNQVRQQPPNYDSVATCLRWERALPCNRYQPSTCPPPSVKVRPLPNIVCNNALISPPLCGSLHPTCPY